jgi:hypothetical protein
MIISEFSSMHDERRTHYVTLQDNLLKWQTKSSILSRKPIVTKMSLELINFMEAAKKSHSIYKKEAKNCIEQLIQ